MASVWAAVPLTPLPAPSTPCLTLPIRMHTPTYWISQPARLWNRRRQVRTPHVFDALPTAVLLHLPYLQRLPLVSGWLTVGVVDSERISALGIGKLPGSGHFDRRRLPTDSQTRRP